MAFDLPFPPFPHDSRDVPFIATPDENNGYTVPSSQYFKKLVGEKYLWTPVSADDPMPTSDATSQAKLAEILAKLSADPATQTTLAAILEKIIAAPATEAKQTALNALIGEVQAAPTANTLLARLKNLETKVDAIIADGLKLSGSNQGINIVSSLDFTELLTKSSASLTGGCIDVTKIKRRIGLIINQHDQAIKVIIQGKASNSTTDFNITTPVKKVEIAAGASLSINSTTYPLIDEPFGWLLITLLQGSTPPTTGNVLYSLKGGN